ncbi:MAG TPA: META domain-containing protein [Candidatus Sulfomarinibacteraceae bacterium]|nr:META domain-containing protein [Candidatus Sulfomarinibacteraceae bacterium]
MSLANPNRKITLVALVVLALMLLTACAPATDSGEPGAAQPTEEPTTAPTPTAEAEATEAPDETESPDGAEADLVGSRWNLVTYGGEQPLADSRITIDFMAEGELGGIAGCNHYGASYTSEEGAFSVGEIERTLMACEGLMEQEDRYLEMLRAARSFVLEDETLTILTTEGDLVYEPAGDVALEGTEWTLSGIAENDAVVSTWVDAEITASFSDGVMNGSAGCNSYSTDYTVEGDTLSLGEVIRTEMACEEDERMEREETFIFALENVASYEIVRETLTLLDDEGNMVMNFTMADAR